jgi:hypothetical protein
MARMGLDGIGHTRTNEDIHVTWYTRTARDMIIESKVVPTIYDSIVIRK